MIRRIFIIVQLLSLIFMSNGIAGDKIFQEGIRIGTSTNTTDGTVRWNGTNFQGYKSGWTNLDLYSLSGFTTSDLSEGTNLYYTDERVDDRVSTLIQNGTGITWSYDDGAGTLTPTVTVPDLSGEPFYTSSASGNLSAETVLSAGEGIDLIAGVISGEDASTTNKGIASFSSLDFSVSSGAVSLVLASGDTYTNFGIAGDDTLDELFASIDDNWTIDLSGEPFYTSSASGNLSAETVLSAGEGIDLVAGVISGEDASDTNKGIASFSSDHFSVSSGAVSILTDGIDDSLIDWGTGTNQVSSTDIPHEVIGSSTYSTMKHAFDLFTSAGRITGGTITDAGGATVDVAAGTGVIRIADDDVSTVKFFDWSASSAISIPTDTIRFLGVEYNAGSPQIVSRTSQNWDYDTDFPLGIVVNENDSLHIVNSPYWTSDSVTNVTERVEAVGIIRDERTKGIIVSSTGTRNLAVSAGALWHRLNEFSIAAIDTSVADTFDSYYYNGSAWVLTESLTQWPNTHYNNIASGLVALSANRYVNLWWYMTLYGEPLMVYGQAQHVVVSNAEAEEPPTSLPSEISYLSILIGRFIVQEGNSSTISEESAFGTSFVGALAADHGSLTGLSDDDHSQYWNQERGEDGVSTLIQNGTGITWSYDDGAGTLTPTVTVPDLSGEPFYTSSASGNLSAETVLSAGEGIDLVAGVISGEDASDTNKGIASFDASDFSVSSGAVSLVLAAGDSYTNFGAASDDTLDELFAAIDTAWPSGGTPAGNDGNVQYNNGGSFGGEDELFWDDSNNRLGIGTSSPQKELDVSGAASGKITVMVTDYYNSDVDAGQVLLRHARGTEGSPSALNSADRLGIIALQGHDGTSWGAGGYITWWTTEAWSSGNHGSELKIYTVPNSSDVQTLAMTIGQDQSVTLKSGTGINEFSVDDTLGGDSDDAVPTEQAVKAYVDTGLALKEDLLTNEAGLYSALSDVSDFVQALEANSIDSVMYVDASIDHEHLNADIISGMTEVTSADADYILLLDATDGALKKCDMGEVRGGGSGTPAGNDGNVQYNNGGSFGGEDELFWDDSNNRLGIGNTSPGFAISIKGNTLESSTLSLWNQTNSTTGPSIIFYKDNNGAAVQTSDLLGSFSGYGYDGVDSYAIGGWLGFYVNGTVGDDDIPTKFMIYLKEESGGAPQAAFCIDDERRIDTYGYLDINEEPIIIDGDIGTNQTGSGYIVEQTVDANSSGIGAALHMDDDSHWIEADASATATMPCAGIALESGTGTKKVLIRGYYRDDSAFSFTVGGIVYVSTTTGDFTQTAPSTTGEQVQIVGYAYTADILYFDPNFMLIEIA